MKKINLGKKLKLDKETITRLNEQAMVQVSGEGIVAISYVSCLGSCPASGVDYTVPALAQIAPMCNSCCYHSCNG
ncbi:class I lanthipeptide [Chitinophaga sp.]|uniref:class I lanthipeptide n=1 Tax=Chitinophaga sp. TaxID=1869181 RepID=UPI0031D2FB4F